MFCHDVKGMVEADAESNTQPLLLQDMKEGVVEAEIESNTEPPPPTAVEKDMSWRINVEELPALAKRRKFWWPCTSHISFRFQLF